MVERKLRRTQAAGPAGVGAIIDVLGESFVAEDISRWHGRWDLLKAPRIAAHFGVTNLRTPPAAENGASGLPFFRFPQWLFCGRCRRMVRWSIRQEKPGEPARCQVCKEHSQLVPMRFVAVCGNGHLEDVRWDRWAHSRPDNPDQRQCGKPLLRFEHLSQVGGGLDSLVVRCDTCKARRNLRDLPAPGALKSIGLTCLGGQPWQFSNERVTCDENLIVLQRGASSVHYPLVVSAIDIPPDSNWVIWGGPMEQILGNMYFQLVLRDPQSQLAENLLDTAAQQVGVTPAEIRHVLSTQLGATHSPRTTDERDLEVREWEALVNPAEAYDPRDYFISRRVSMPSANGHLVLQPFADLVAERLTDVVVVDRLREIRALTGFGRHTMQKTVEPALGRRVDFLPAVEVFGEGVFLRLSESALREWETVEMVARRVIVLRDRLKRSYLRKSIADAVTPRLIMIHTLAHLLMRQMSFDAGYSASALRERVYSTKTPESPLGGVLVYTGAGDSEGSLGGLARLGVPERLVPILARALGAAQWCSLDPVCRESSGQGTDSLSLAACHACALASETSCTHSNVLLDRALLVDPDFGFFRREVAQLLSIQSESLILCSNCQDSLRCLRGTRLYSLSRWEPLSSSPARRGPGRV
jgi:hypothetical protein